MNGTIGNNPRRTRLIALPGHFSRDKGRPRRHENCLAALSKLHSPPVYAKNPRRKRQHLLGHTLKGIGMSLGISTNLEAVTAQYVDVRLERKQSVLETYHKALQPQKAASEKGAEQKEAPKKSKKKSSEMEL
jgi:hypothetical protein